MSERSRAGMIPDSASPRFQVSSTQVALTRRANCGMINQ